MARIIIADDDPTTIFMVRSILEDCGHIVGALEDGLSVGDVARFKAPDLLILDCSMPGKTGLEALREVRADLGKQLPIMMLTGRTSPQDEALAYQAGADDYLTKPIDPDKLVIRVEALLDPARRRCSA
ncbi:response regulator transcription factor [Sphingomicrobium flavum]|uniref:response regulator transcription factor n=1 Tax=Sphingomicrobium flavum TaxID=1229164 RepID=UPI0021ADFAD7|nr:response regulator transcription factor [Sphingomicrobium flavum]